MYNIPINYKVSNSQEFYIPYYNVMYKLIVKMTY